MSVDTSRLERQVEELWDRQTATEAKVMVIETHLLNINKTLTSINSHVSKFVWAVMAILLSGLLGLLIR